MSQLKEKTNELALLGGPPAITREPPAWPFFDDSDRKSLFAVLESRVWGGYHESVAEFERRFAAFHQAQFGIATANGTVSLEIALTAAGVQPGDEVIVPPITFVASATAIARVGAVPVFVDIDPNTINLDPVAVERAITERTRGIVLVHFAGCPADFDSFTALCQKHKLVLIEDCAHAHGAEWKGRRVGTFGQFGSFSFQGSKNMTAGEGGILITNDPDLAESARSIGNQGRRTGGEWYEHVTLGTNARLTGFQASVLLNQLERLPAQLQTRSERAAQLRQGLKEIYGVKATPQDLDERITTHGLHLFSMRIDEAIFKIAPRSGIISALQAEGLPVTPGYPHPIYRNKLFQAHAHRVHDCPVAEAYCRSSVWLPHNVLLADATWIDEALTAMQKVLASLDNIRAFQ